MRQRRCNGHWPTIMIVARGADKEDRAALPELRSSRERQRALLQLFAQILIGDRFPVSPDDLLAPGGRGYFPPVLWRFSRVGHDTGAFSTTYSLG